jgi:4-azaleucine resistance transporter AzlC
MNKEFLNGVKGTLPILAGVLPFGLIYGVLAPAAGVSPIAAMAMSFIVFAGSAQVVMVQLIGENIPLVVIIVTAVVFNLRHILYSASIAPYVSHLSTRWRWMLAYFLTDEAYAVAITRYKRNPENQYGHWHFLGAGLTLWASWQVSTALGLLVGAQLPESWSLDFAIALTFIALVVPMLNDRDSALAALVAALTAVGVAGIPYKLDLIVATVVGMVAGVGASVITQRRSKNAQ